LYIGSDLHAAATVSPVRGRPQAAMAHEDKLLQFWQERPKVKVEVKEEADFEPDSARASSSKRKAEVKPEEAAEEPESARASSSKDTAEVNPEAAEQPAAATSSGPVLPQPVLPKPVLPAQLPGVPAQAPGPAQDTSLPFAQRPVREGDWVILQCCRQETLNGELGVVEKVHECGRAHVRLEGRLAGHRLCWVRPKHLRLAE
jgi:hypothetical protein